MSLTKIKRYYLVDEELYNQIKKQGDDSQEHFVDMRPKDRKRCQSLLDFIEENGAQYNIIGITTEIIPEMKVNFNIIEYIMYCIHPKGQKPLLFDYFVEYLRRIRPPINLFALKIAKLIQYNGKKRKASS